MTCVVLTDVYCTVNSVNLSAELKQVMLEYNAEDLDDSVMGSAWKVICSGAKAARIQLTFRQGYGSGSVNATLQTAFGSVITVVLRPTSAAVGTSNPQWSQSFHASNYQPLAGRWGENAENSVSWNSSGAPTITTS